MMSVDPLVENRLFWTSRAADTCTNGFRCLPYSISAQLFIIHSWHFNVNVNAIQQWTRNSFLIFGDQSRCTCTRLLCISIETAWTGVHRSDQLEVCRKS